MAHALINIDVDDLARATKFYCHAFDLAIGRRFADASSRSSSESVSIVSASSSAIRMLSSGSAADLALACMAAKSATTLLYECCVACGRQKWLAGGGFLRICS